MATVQQTADPSKHAAVPVPQLGLETPRTVRITLLIMPNNHGVTKVTSDTAWFDMLHQAREALLHAHPTPAHVYFYDNYVSNAYGTIAAEFLSFPELRYFEIKETIPFLWIATHVEAINLLNDMGADTRSIGKSHALLLCDEDFARLIPGNKDARAYTWQTFDLGDAPTTLPRN